jgi:hypothetical protein
MAMAGVTLARTHCTALSTMRRLVGGEGQSMTHGSVGDRGRRRQYSRAGARGITAQAL